MLFNSFQVLHRLSSINRYSRDKFVHPETDLEHIGWVSMWSYLAAKDIESQLGGEVSIDYGKLLIKAVSHEFDETLTGDVSSPTKYYNNDVLKSHKLMESHSVKSVERFLNLSIYEDWANAKDSSLEGIIVKWADTLAVVYKVWVEVNLFNNSSFGIVLEEISDTIDNIGSNLEHQSGCEEQDDITFRLNSIFYSYYIQAKDILNTSKSINEFKDYLPGRIPITGDN